MAPDSASPFCAALFGERSSARRWHLHRQGRWAAASARGTMAISVIKSIIATRVASFLLAPGSIRSLKNMGNSPAMDGVAGFDQNILFSTVICLSLK
ncbi:hypothetical protein [Devosia limi]|uniref:hypothetical protein n=1 Tax=Devosia limi TaxID=288995 RepID=UPI0011608D09|nr:hypothetical protein [Devosia limi]